MADFGLVGAWSDRNPIRAMLGLLDPLPDVFTTLWGSDHLQQAAARGAVAPRRGLDTDDLPRRRDPRFRVGHLVLAPSFRNPALLAAMATTLAYSEVAL
jgi:hypothetical protein